MTRLLVECTHVFQHPKVNSGIQRVVRNVINQLPESVDGVECIPVVMLNGKLYRVLMLGALNIPFFDALMIFGGRLGRLAHRFWQLHQRLHNRSHSRVIKRLLHVAYRVTAVTCFSLPLRVIEGINQYQLPKRCTPLQHQPGDQLVLLDSSWHTDFFPFAEQLKREGVGIVSVIYDLIPVTHPQFYDARLVQVFNEWFDWISKTADGYVAISATVRDQVREELQRRLGPAKASELWFDYFHLGSELDLSEATAAVEPRLTRLFKTPEPVFLMVSTIEPRKNHDYLLDAFELAWAAGSKAQLCIAGRIGWKCDALLARVRNHPQLNQRLFMFNDLSDTSLEHAYSNASALVFPSWVEGFGLPLVEAMQRGLPAMGSDIPIFREIGGEFMAYFDLAEPQTLADLVARFESSGQFPAARDVADWHWIGWCEASAQLAEHTLRNLIDVPLVQERQHANCP
ncbi:MULTISPECIES: glycosyltransferase family 1 protein [Pseudomonas]|jgi:alpha-1,2-rhamnosyltransferase|uniref:glycosyltransferase family 4 protein n=1 Tax=Pseudomonas TaxID=286 RepID=UPI0005FB996D|nr:MULTISPECIES: glycosyltransferase family 1 protein [Pseudomonas]KJZ36616.1 glycosyl transferase [Pseudomonas fluorescens]OOG12731.1 glycosyl transferase [Pseudomonas sp. C9]